MAFMGVLISWLMLARNSLFAREAASADIFSSVRVWFCLSISLIYRTIKRDVRDVNRIAGELFPPDIFSVYLLIAHFESPFRKSRQKRIFIGLVQ
jgi:hypothetical protein